MKINKESAMLVDIQYIKERKSERYSIYKRTKIGKYSRYTLYNLERFRYW